VHPAAPACVPRLPRLAGIRDVSLEVFSTGMWSKAFTEVLTIDEFEMLRRRRSYRPTDRASVIWLMR